MLAEAKRVDEVKSIRDKAEAMQVYAKQAKDRDLIAHATEIRMRAEIRAGELLPEMEKNKGAQGTGSNQHQVRSHDATAPLKLSDIDVTKTQSSRCGSCGHRQPFAPETIVPARRRPTGRRARAGGRATRAAATDRR